MKDAAMYDLANIVNSADLADVGQGKTVASVSLFLGRALLKMCKCHKNRKSTIACGDTCWFVVDFQLLVVFIL
jgi:hypothetical protein